MRAFAAADDRIDAHSFPATAEELITEYGHVELELPNGRGRPSRGVFRRLEGSHRSTELLGPGRAVDRREQSRSGLFLTATVSGGAVRHRERRTRRCQA